MRARIVSGVNVIDGEATLCADVAAARRCIQAALPGAILLQPEGCEPPPIFEVWG
jgi:hypothetical protein